MCCLQVPWSVGACPASTQPVALVVFPSKVLLGPTQYRVPAVWHLVLHFGYQLAQTYPFDLGVGLIQRLNLALVQLYKVNVLLDPVQLAALWDDNDTPLDCPRQRHDSSRASMLLCDLREQRMCQDWILPSQQLTAQGAPADDPDVLVQAIRHKLQVGVQSVQLDLVDGRRYRCVLQQTIEQLRREVADANPSAFVSHQPLHALPRLPVRWVSGVVLRLLIDRHGVWPVHEEDVDVANVQVAERVGEGSGRVMEACAPEFGDDRDVGARDARVADRFAYD